MRRTNCFFVALLLFTAPVIGRAHANDSTALIAAGGIELTGNKHISMVSENLYVSEREIRVDYVFKNISQNDITTLVAFPLPDLDLSLLSESDVVGMNDSPSNNFLNFSVTVNGQKIAHASEFKAYAIGSSIDIAANLDQYKLPWQSMTQRLRTALQDLNSTDAAALEKLGAIGVAGEYRNPLWLVQGKFYWQQNFPAGQSVTVSHRYNPIVAHSFFYRDELNYGNTAKEYCVDEGTKAAILKKLAAKSEPELYTRRIDYILKTANNWAGPIGDFTLTLDKGLADNIISVCLSGLSKTSPTTFVYKAKQFSPKNDLKVLIVTGNIN